MDVCAERQPVLEDVLQHNDLSSVSVWTSMRTGMVVVRLG